MAGGHGRSQKNKAHKSRFSSKSSRTEHKVAKGDLGFRVLVA